jgi:hypothetical protein
MQLYAYTLNEFNDKRVVIPNEIMNESIGIIHLVLFHSP